MENEVISRIRNEVAKAIVGQDDKINKVLMCIIADGDILLEDSPGTGKTVLASAFADALGVDHGRIQFTSDTMPSDIVGLVSYNQKTCEYEIRKKHIFDENIEIFDEINRAPAKTQSALLSIMEEKKYSFDVFGGQSEEKLPELFSTIATMNPNTSPYEGTNSLPQPMLDRFMIALSLGYPNKQDEIEMLKRKASNSLDYKVQKVTNETEILRIRKEVQNVYVSSLVLEYISDLAITSRQSTELKEGISPRGEINLLNLARANAYFKGRVDKMGRYYVTIGDIDELFVDANIHRIVLKDQNQRNFKIIDDKRVNALKNVLRDTKAKNRAYSALDLGADD